MSEPVLAADAFYDQFRRGADLSSGPGVELYRMRFDADPANALAGRELWEQNEHFEYPLFMPTLGPREWQDVVIILNGLNDSSYRKFFPWAASIARAGMPALVFPSAFLINRRPRAWITPEATARALEARSKLAPGSATPINAVLSQRVAEAPESLLEDAVRTCQDLRQLAAAVRGGGLELRGHSGSFAPNARCHLLGYSLGGYLALALRLEHAAFSASRVITLCAGASTAGSACARLDPESPFILDRHASERLLAEIEAVRRLSLQLGPLASTLVELLTGTSESTRQRIRDLDDELTVLAAPIDRIVPTRGIAENLGRIDAVLPLGIHEYPFNLLDLRGPGVSRSIAQAYRVAPRFEPGFRSFLDRVCASLGCGARPSEPVTRVA